MKVYPSLSKSEAVVVDRVVATTLLAIANWGYPVRTDSKNSAESYIEDHLREAIAMCVTNRR